MSSISKLFLLSATILLPFDFLKIIYNFSFIDLLYLLSLLFIVVSHFKDYDRFKNRLTENIFLFPLIIYSVGFFISFNNSFDPLDSFFAYSQIFFIFIIIYYSFSLNTLTQPVLQNTLYFLSIITTFIMLNIFLFFLTGKDYSNGLLLVEKGWGMIRFSYGDLEPNVTARIILQCFPILFLFVIKKRSWTIKLFNVIMILILLAALVLTVSRSGLVIFLIGIFLFFVFYFKYSHYYNIVRRGMYLFFILIGLFFVYKAFPNFFENSLTRYATIFNPSQSQSSKERILILEKSIENINEGPIVGYGLGNSHNLTGGAAHNSIIISWLENGIFGFIGFILIYLIIIYYVIIAYNNKFYNNAILLVLAVMSIMMIVGDMFMANSYKRIAWVPAILFVTYFRQIYLYL